MAVSIFLQGFGAVQGYDLVINEKKATVQDYLDALNDAFNTFSVSRVRGLAHAKCVGCDACCAERAPLTLVDCLRLLRAANSGSVGEFLSRYSTVSVSGPVVDIALRRLSDGYCIFLDRKSRTCRVYMARPFVCQTFMCCPATPQALEIREAVVNKGEDELVREWLKTGRQIHYAERPQINVRDWGQTCFSGKTLYEQVALRGVLPAGLWRRLYVT